MTSKVKKEVGKREKKAPPQKSGVRLVAELLSSLWTPRSVNPPALGAAAEPYDALVARAGIRAGQYSPDQIAPRLVPLFAEPSMTTEELGALVALLNYAEPDEREHYNATPKGERSGHVYEHIRVLRGFAKRQKGGRRGNQRQGA